MDFFSVCDAEHVDDNFSRVHFVENAVVSFSNSIRCPAAPKAHRGARKRVVLQAVDDRFHVSSYRLSAICESRSRPALEAQDEMSDAQGVSLTSSQATHGLSRRLSISTRSSASSSQEAIASWTTACCLSPWRSQNASSFSFSFSSTLWVIVTTPLEYNQ